MKTLSRIVLSGLAASALLLAGCQLATETKKKDVVEAGPTDTVASPSDILLTGAIGSAKVSAGYNNTTTEALTIASVAKESDTGYTPINADLDGTWVDTGLDLGTKSLAFDFASVAGASADSGHVVVSLKNLTGLSRAGKTGFTFTLKFSDAPSGSAVGLMPHLRYNDGASENAVAFGWEHWYWKTDKAYFEVKVPFTAFTKPGYGLQTETTIAALPAATEFNQIDFDIRIAPESAGKFVSGTKYHAILDRVGYY